MHRLAFLLALGVASSAFGQTLTPSSVTAVAGAPVTLPLTFTSQQATPASGLQWTLYSPVDAVTNISVAAGPSLTSAQKSLTCKSEPGAYTCVAFGMNATSIASGVVASVTMTASKSATIRIESALGAAPNGSPVAITGQTGTVTVAVPAPPPPTQPLPGQITSLTCISSQMQAGMQSICTVKLSAPAPAGGLTLSLQSSNSASVSVPATVKVSAGAPTASFPIAAAASNLQTGTVTLTASLAGAGSASTALNCVGASALASLTCTPASIGAGSQASCSVALSGAAPAAGLTVALQSSSTVLMVPSSVFIPAASVSAAFTATAGATNTNVSANLTASSQTPDVSSVSATVSVVPATSGALLHLRGDAAEVGVTQNGAVVTPAAGPAGFTGKLFINGTGSVTYPPAVVGQGVQFQKCCENKNNAYYLFAGSQVGSVFGNSAGSISFYLKSRYSLAERHANASTLRYSFDVRDGSGNHIFAFATQSPSNGRLVFYATADGTASYYYAPLGKEDVLFGKDVAMKVAIGWDGKTATLHLNDTLVKSWAYTRSAPNWTSSSLFTLGGYQYLTFGAYQGSEDTIDEFEVSAAR